MQGTFLNKATEWFNKAVQYEQSGKDIKFWGKALDLAIECEKKGIAAGEKW